ncbi:MAG: transporter substrate-binding domain-containing protein [Candidatus Cloacimonetes bacterium]|nr:transporter substrate-binding domain-containing protein [Candidatus Cloacimonadota bacterium]
MIKNYLFIAKRIILVVWVLAFWLILYSKDTLNFATVDFPPYSFMDQGEIKGFQVDLIKKMCELADIECTFSILPFKRSYESVLDFRISKYDAIFNFYKNPERLKIFEYSEAILENPLVFFVRKGADFDFQGDMSVFSKKRIGLMNGYTYSPEFTELIEKKRFEFEEAHSHESNFKKLYVGRIDIYPVEKYVGLYVASELRIINYLEILSEPLVVQKGYIGMAKDNPKVFLLQKMNEALKKIKENGDYDMLLKRYIRIN